MDIAAAEAVVVKGRFCGSPMTASGGYIAGLLGRHVDGPARVSLDAPIPVDRAFGIERLVDGRVVLSDDSAAVLAHAEPATLQIEPPTPPSFAEAQWASERYLGFTEHASPECFVCGPAREWGDGLAIFPGRCRAGAWWRRPGRRIRRSSTSAARCVPSSSGPRSTARAGSRCSRRSAGAGPC